MGKCVGNMWGTRSGNNFISGIGNNFISGIRNNFISGIRGPAWEKMGAGKMEREVRYW